MSADIELRRAPLNELRLLLAREALASAGTATSVGGSPSGSAAFVPGRIRNAGSLLVGAAAPSRPREVDRSLLREPQHVRLWNMSTRSDSPPVHRFLRSCMQFALQLRKVVP